MTVHYCGGEIDHFAFGMEDNGPCRCGDGPMKSDCCKDLFFGGATLEEHTISENEPIDFIAFEKFQLAPLPLFTCYAIPVEKPSPSWNICSHPPDKPERKIFLSVRSLLI